MAWLRRDLEHRGPRHPSAAYVLHYGRSFSPAPRPPGVRKRRSRYCYRNATLFVQEIDERYAYCEGWALSSLDGGMTVQHAWVTLTGDKAVELTWAEPGRAYLGVVIEPDQLSRFLVERRSFGSVIDWLVGIDY